MYIAQMQTRRLLVSSIFFFMKIPTLISIITPRVHKMLSQTMGRFKVSNARQSYFCAHV